MTRYVRFWLTGPFNSDDITGMRGQYGMSGVDDVQLYEIVKEGDRWRLLRWLDLKTDPDAIAQKEIFSSEDCFACMVAAENDAKSIEEQAWEEEHEDG